jgi:hypothetical protein
MSNPITTAGLGSGSVSTTHQSGESTRDWIEAHNTAIEPQSASGDKLTTTWTSASGLEKVETFRLPNEDDETFILRHENDYLTAMTGALPIP